MEAPMKYAANIASLLSETDCSTADIALAIAKQLITYRAMREASDGIKNPMEREANQELKTLLEK